MSRPRRYRLVDEQTRADAVATVLSRIRSGDSFTSACKAVSAQIDVSASAVREWVNESGERPQPNWDTVIRLRAELAAATELNRRLSADRGRPPSEHTSQAQA